MLARLPQPIAPTLYARFGDRIPAVLLLIALACVIARRTLVARMSVSDIRATTTRIAVPAGYKLGVLGCLTS